MKFLWVCEICEYICVSVNICEICEYICIYVSVNIYMYIYVISISY